MKRSSREIEAEKVRKWNMSNRPGDEIVIIQGGKVFHRRTVSDSYLLNGKIAVVNVEGEENPIALTGRVRSVKAIRADVSMLATFGKVERYRFPGWKGGFI